MHFKTIAKYSSWAFLFASLAFVVSSLLSTSTAYGAVATKWSYDLTGFADLASPVLADVNGDSFLDVVAVTDQGHVTVVKHDGQLLWDRDVSAHMGMPANSLVIASSPAVGDLDNDGTVEVVVGTGSRAGACQNDGGIIVLSHTGNVEPGWPYKTTSWLNLCAVFSSPALADIDNDGDLEIVTGSFNKQILAFHHNGQLVAGFPPDSPLAFRFPAWPELKGRLADTIWSSPAIANTDGDDFLEIYLGSDEGHFGDEYGGNRLNWFCPYSTATEQYCGGSMHGINHDGQEMANAPKLLWEHVQSTPAIADINEDGVLDIVFGTGTYYNDYTGGIEYDERIIVIDSQTMAFLPGWNDVSNPDPRVEDWGGGKIVSDSTPASPAVGDIAGDDGLEVIAITLSGQLYAWFADGSLVPGFPMTPLHSFGDGTTGTFNAGTGLILGDTDGDDKMEILLGKSWDVVIIDGNGAQLSARGSGKPVYNAAYTISNIPAVGDLDKDGELELVVTSQGIHVWDLDGSSAKADWPMYKQNENRTSAIPIDRPILEANKSALIGIKLQSDASAIEKELTLSNTGTMAYDWSLSSVPAGVSVNPSSGTVNPGGQVDLTVTINVNSTLNDSFIINAIDEDNKPALNSPLTIDVDVFVVDTIHRGNLPFITR